MVKSKSIQSSEGSKTAVQRLIAACGEGKLDLVRRITGEELGNDVKLLNEVDIDDDRKRNGLIMAATFGHAPVVEFLLGKGCSKSIVTSTGASAFLLAAEEGHIACVKLLFAEAQLNKPSFRGNTPLILAAQAGHPEIVTYLIRNGVELDSINLKGETAVMRASECGKAECLQLLINAKADLMLRDEDGWDALYMAREAKNDECERLLLAGGAKDNGAPAYPIDEDFLRENFVPQDQDVDDMRVQTMFKMVDECRVICDGKDVIKKVLYLTNKQAVMFTEDAMERAVVALDIGEPKFVIKLVDSIGISAQMRVAHKERANDPESIYGKSTYNTSEICSSDERIVEQQIIFFMKTAILPLAMQTRALILVSGSNDCYLSTALARVALAEQARLGKDCPFTVLATSCEMEVHARAVSPKSDDRMCIAQQLARASPSWGKRLAAMNDFYSKKLLPSSVKLPQCDLTEAAERYIIFESFEEGQDEDELGSYNNGPRKQFESTFLQYMTRKLPSIAIVCLQPSHGVPFLVDLANRNIPVLLLDCTERAFTLEKFDPTMEIQTKLAKKADAFPKIAEEQVKKIRVEDGALTNESRMVLINVAFEMIERKMSVLMDHAVVDSLQISMLAFFHAVLNIGAEIAESASFGSVPLFARIRELEKYERTNRDAKKSGVPFELASKVMDFLFGRMKALDLMCLQSKVDEWIDNHPAKYRYLRTDAIALNDALEKEVDVIEKNEGLLESGDLNATEWLATYDLLTSSNVFSVSVFDVDETKRILGSVAKIDRLPTSNTLEALRVIQDGWDHVEVYHEMADTYKVIAKLTYVMLLLASMLMTVFAIFESNGGDDAYPAFSSRLPVMLCGFIASALTSYVAYVNPAVKWQQLRVAALSIESNIWTFRCRAGPYRCVDADFNHEDDKHLAESIKEIKERVLEGSGIKDTAFYSQKRTKNKHGQHPSNNHSFGALDNFTRHLEHEMNKSMPSRLFSSLSSWFPGDHGHEGGAKQPSFSTMSLHEQLRAETKPATTGGSGSSFDKKTDVAGAGKGSVAGSHTGSAAAAAPRGFCACLQRALYLIYYYCCCGWFFSACISCCKTFCVAIDYIIHCRCCCAPLKKDVPVTEDSVAIDMTSDREGQSEGLFGGEGHRHDDGGVFNEVASEDGDSNQGDRGSELDVPATPRPATGGAAWDPWAALAGALSPVATSPTKEAETVAAVTTAAAAAATATPRAGEKPVSTLTASFGGTATTTPGGLVSSMKKSSDLGRVVAHNKERATATHRPLSGINKKDQREYPLAQILMSLRRDVTEFDGHVQVNSHYEPLQPDSYIRFRILPAISFYKRRIPEKSWVKGISQFLLVVGSIACVGLSILDLSPWAPAITIFMGAVTAWIEFSGTNSKISRYSNTVHALSELVYWWQTLPQIDRSVVNNIDRLVLSCEELLQREQQAWRATSQTVKMLKKQSEDASKGGEGGNEGKD